MVQAAGGAPRGGVRERETAGRTSVQERVSERAAVSRVGLEASRWRE